LVNFYVFLVVKGSLHGVLGVDGTPAISLLKDLPLIIDENPKKCQN